MLVSGLICSQQHGSRWHSLLVLCLFGLLKCFVVAFEFKVGISAGGRTFYSLSGLKALFLIFELKWDSKS